MANSIKKKKTPPAPNPVELNPDQETNISVKEVIRDERTGKVTGVFFLLLAAFLLVAFTSYIFTWQEDQDKLFQWGIRIFAVKKLHMENQLGAFGAFVAHQLIYNGFGLASYLFCTTFFVLGVNWLFDSKIFRITRNLKYVVVGLVIFSVTLSFAIPANGFPWGGAVGDWILQWVEGWLGFWGTAALLITTCLAFFIWRFNPVFTLPSRKASSKTTGTKDESVFTENDSYVVPEDDEKPVFQQWNQQNTAENPLEGAKLIIHDDFLEKSSPNTLIDNPEALANDTWEDEEIKDEVLLNSSSLVNASGAPLELEIKETSEEKKETLSEKTGTIGSKYDATLDLKNYKYPSLSLLEQHGSEKIVHDPQELETNKNQIIATLKNYDISIQRIAATVGPTVTLYEIVPAPGVRISRIKNLEDDIALSLAALGIRIIAPIPGKGTIGIEVPNVRKSVVSMKTLLASDKFQSNSYSLPIAIGKKIDNENFIVDLANMPHLLMAGATGQGKSVGVNALLVSLLYKKHPSQLKLVLVDPKKVELSLYRVIEKHFLAKLPGEEESIITDTKKVVHTLNALCIEMDNRYDLLKEAGCRNIREYNEKFTERKLNPLKGHQYLPFIVLVVDEFADLIMTAGKEIEMPIARLAQLARAIGIHLIIATQRPSVNIITGTIKANFPARIAFKVSSKIDSRTILDAGGAEQLIGKGDMLISYGGEITRLQCAFVDTPEVEKICEFIEKQPGYPEAFRLPEYVDEKELEGKDFDSSNRDPLFEEAARLIVNSQMGSTSLIQRRMKLGYNRAGRLMDQLEAAGIVGANQGSKARDVLFKTEAELNQFLQHL
ncbi:MAG: DNA translocase FtsK 4TM domain-containing protein [Chitinophagia bacterium]|jgi:S-DNA-T family DNA segregation ATPase FtsK/SpoIIIE